MTMSKNFSAMSLTGFRTNMAGVISDLMSPRKKMNDSHSQTKTSNMRRE